MTGELHVCCDAFMILHGIGGEWELNKEKFVFSAEALEFFMALHSKVHHSYVSSVHSYVDSFPRNKYVRT